MNREVAAKLFVSDAAVQTHLVHVHAEPGVKDRAAAVVVVAYERGLLKAVTWPGPRR